MFNALFSLLRDHIKEARVGGVVGSVSVGTVLFLDAGSWQAHIVDWGIRLFFALAAGILSAIGAAVGKDIVENYKKYRASKTKEYNEQRKKDKAA